MDTLFLAMLAAEEDRLNDIAAQLNSEIPAPENAQVIPDELFD